jgi:hypothetical protein
VHWFPIDVLRVLRAPKVGSCHRRRRIVPTCVLQRGRASLGLASSAVTTYWNWKPLAKPLILNCLLEISPVCFPRWLLALETFPHGIVPR